MTHYPIRTLREPSWRTRSRYHGLSDSQFSPIISLFGTVSAHDPPSPIYESVGPTHGQGELSGLVGLHFSGGARQNRVTGLLNEGELYRH
jgi:hypothetical protein